MLWAECVEWFEDWMLTVLIKNSYLGIGETQIKKHFKVNVYEISMALM